MVNLVAFDDATEALVRFVEETPPAAMAGAALARLREGEEPRDLIRAAALAVSRSCELPVDHHGGPLHPVAGIHATMGLTARLAGAWRLLPALQCAALANRHIHTPSMGPAAMVAFDDLERGLSADEALAALERALEDREARLAERAVALACEKAPPGRLLGSLLEVALRRNALDDHYLLYPLYAMRAADAVGWRFAPVLLRPVARYLSRHASLESYGALAESYVRDGVDLYHRFGELEELMAAHGIAAGKVPQKTGPHEVGAVAALAEEVGAVATIRSLPETVARAMGGGLSLEGTLEALSAGGARIFLRSHSNNPFDVHIHTGIAARRYLLSFPEVSFRHKALALLGWAWSNEIRYLDWTLTWPWQNADGAADGRSTAQRAGEDGLAAIEQAVAGLEGYDAAELARADRLVASEALRDVMRLAEGHVKAGGDVEALFALAARLACREDLSEMHACKMQQAAWEEYRACREPLRWPHAVAAVKHCAVALSIGPHSVYPRIAAQLAA